MSFIVLIACVATVWALLSLVDSDRAARQATVDAAAAAAAAMKRRAEDSDEPSAAH